MKKKKSKEGTVEYYMELPYTIKLTPMENGGYFAKVEELPGCMSEGPTKEKALENIEEAKELWFEAAIEDGYNIPLPEEMENYSGKFVVRLPKYLHRRLSNQAEKEETSLNQLVVSLLSDRSSMWEVKSKLDDIRREVRKTMMSMKKYYNTRIKNRPDKEILEVAESATGYYESVEKVNKTKYTGPA